MSENAFALFQLNPSPWIDLEALKNQFLTLSASLHPDKFQGKNAEEKTNAEEHFTKITAAYQKLNDPKERLLHLYEIEAGKKPQDVQRIPPGTMDLFIAVGQFCQKVDEFLKKRSAAASALEKAGLMGEGLELQDQLIGLDQKLMTVSAELEKELRQLDQDWRTEKKDLPSLETLYRKFSYLSRWKQQLEERRLALLEN